jgi:DNA-binding GntR family transcriptional regulator
MTTATATRNKSSAATLEQILSNARAAARRPNSDGPSGKAGEIVAELEHRLITGHYRFGDSLSTSLLAGDFEASRQPISAALNHLRGLGYLKIVPQVGCQVVSPSPQDIDDFFSMLAKIESLIAGLAARRFVDNEAGLLLEIAEHIKQIPFDDATHREEWAFGVYAYHGHLRAMARSPVLESRVHGLWRLSDFYLWQGASNLQPRSIEIANRERQQVAKAVASRDVDAAEALMEKHVRGKPRRVGIV